MCLHCPSLRECVSAPCDGRASCPGWALPCTLSCQDRLQPSSTLNWNKWVGKEFSYLFLFIFLKCVYVVHINSSV